VRSIARGHATEARGSRQGAPAPGGGGPEHFERFEQEARAAAALNHPNVLVVFDVGREELGPYIVSELLEGETLRDALSRGALPHGAVVEYACRSPEAWRPLISAVSSTGPEAREHLHNEGAQAKILDFGWPSSPKASPFNTAGKDTVTNITASRTVLGTVGYMSPEQVRAEVTDWRTDIFSFGVVLPRCFPDSEHSAAAQSSRP